MIFLQRLQDRPLVFKGEISVFLSLIFVLLLSFVGAMVEAASISIAKSMKQADLLMATESIFAEYKPELLKRYGIFAKQGSDIYSISNRLAYYGAGNLDHEIKAMELLSDHEGQEFYRQALVCMGGNIIPNRPVIQNPYQEFSQSIKEKFESLEIEVPELEGISTSFLLAQVLTREKALSNKSISIAELPSHRELQTGTTVSPEVDKTLVGRGLFASYLTKHFSNYTEESYEIEYLLAGKSSDEENLEWVAKRLLGVRIAVNYAFLLVDEEEMMKAETLALGITTALLIPEAKEVVKQAFLFFWAYQDSLADLRKLFLGEKVPLGRNEEGNMADYEDYLRAFLFAADTEQLCMRALDLIELNLNIRVDDCVTKLELESTGYARRNIRYTCKTDFAYE